jgi:hypothetical protein
MQRTLLGKPSVAVMRVRIWTFGSLSRVPSLVSRNRMDKVIVSLDIYITTLFSNLQWPHKQPANQATGGAMVELFKDGSFTDAANNEVAVGQTISSGVDMMVRFLPNVLPRRAKQALTDVPCREWL